MTRCVRQTNSSHAAAARFSLHNSTSCSSEQEEFSRMCLQSLTQTLSHTETQHDLWMLWKHVINVFVGDCQPIANGLGSNPVSMKATASPKFLVPSAVRARDARGTSSPNY